jgi:hypothetical protein
MWSMPCRSTLIGMRRIVFALSLLLLLGGCARPPLLAADDSGAASPSPTGPGAVSPSPSDPGDGGRWVTYQADVTAVSLGGDPRSLQLTVSLLAGGDGCSRDPRVTYLTEENNLVYANVVQDSNDAAQCPARTPGDVTLTAAGPINGRTVVLNGEPWKRDGDGYHRCDPTFGCDPMPADHCDPAWIQVAVAAMDVSRHSTATVEGCDGSWLVMTVPFDPVPCGAEPRPGCVPVVSARRYFLTWVDTTGWRTIAGSVDAGCGTVLAVEPDFPSVLCRDLPIPR